MGGVMLIGGGMLGVAAIGVVLFGWVDGVLDRWQRKQLAGVRLVPWLSRSGALWKC